MTAPAEVVELAERFDKYVDAYMRGKYNEAQVRREFVDPFFQALGWDVDNKQGYAEAYKDVVHEDAIRVGHATKAPDYGFRIGGVRKFFVEAKKPLGQHQGGDSPGLPTAALCLERQTSPEHCHRLRGIRRLRLPNQAGQRRWPCHRSHPLPDLQGLR